MMRLLRRSESYSEKLAHYGSREVNEAVVVKEAARLYSVSPSDKSLCMGVTMTSAQNRDIFCILSLDPISWGINVIVGVIDKSGVFSKMSSKVFPITSRDLLRGSTNLQEQVEKWAVARLNEAKLQEATSLPGRLLKTRSETLT